MTDVHLTNTLRAVVTDANGGHLAFSGAWERFGDSHAAYIPKNRLRALGHALLEIAGEDDAGNPHVSPYRAEVAMFKIAHADQMGGVYGGGLTVKDSAMAGIDYGLVRVSDWVEVEFPPIDVSKLDFERVKRVLTELNQVKTAVDARVASAVERIAELIV